MIEVSLFHSVFVIMADTNLYEVLGVSRNATDNEIKKVGIRFNLCFAVFFISLNVKLEFTEETIPFVSFCFCLVHVVNFSYYFLTYTFKC